MQRILGQNSDQKLLLITGIIITILSSAIILPNFKSYRIKFEGERITAYDDRSEKDLPGNSEILSIGRDSTRLSFSYVLKPGFSYPYAGISISLRDADGKFFDCSRYDAIKIKIASSQQSDCKLYLKVFDPIVTKSNDPLSERYLKKDIVVTAGPKTLNIPLRSFITPEWWYQKNNVTLKDVAPLDLSKVTALQIESGATAKIGIIDTLTITEISLTKRPHIYAISLLAFLLVSSGIYFVFRLAPRPEKKPVIITYEKKELQSYSDIDAQRISAYLAEHYSEPDLSIVNVGKSLGMSRKKVAKIMSEEFKMSFKQYLTSIRIHEAKRLLQETDRLVIDIALAVGFNSISHFNRVFKNSTNLSPLEYRNSKEASPASG